MNDMKNNNADLPVQIAEDIKAAIVSGRLIVDERLPSEAELSAHFNVSRPTVREALKRLAAQNLIRTRRGASGGAFVNRLRYEDAYSQQITTSTLLLSMNEIRFETACEARFALERACVRLSTERRTEDHLATMRAETHRQSQPGLSDEAFCASDVAFHRALVDGAGNPILSFQLAGAIEAIEPLMNMLTFTQRDRDVIVSLHTKIADALEARSTEQVKSTLVELSDYTLELFNQAARQRSKPSG